MHRGRPVKLVELFVFLAIVFGIRAVTHADALGSIRGRVTIGEAAVGGARVAARCGAVTRTATADASGSFVIAAVPPGRCTLTVHAAGFTAGRSTVTVAAGATAAITVALVRAPVPPATPVATGRTDTEAKPAPRAEAAERTRGDKRAKLEAAPYRVTRRPIAAGAAQIAGSHRRHLGDVGHNTEAYARIDDNPFHHAATAPLSTFSSDVDTASYANLRRFLAQGTRPPKDAVRIEEMLNYFTYAYPPAPRNQPFSITTEVGPAPWNPQHQLVRIGLQAPEIDDRQVPARNLVFLLDVSGSMNTAAKLPLLKQAMNLLVETLRPQDRVSIVVYAGASGVALPPTRGSDKDTIRQAIFALEAGGSTNGAAGIQLAYQLAAQHKIAGGINRVILCTDGDFNIGVTSEGELTRLIEQERERGVFLTVLGFGMGNYQDARMEKLADRGNGNYGYVDSLFEARKLLVKEAGATLVTVAKDVKLQVELNPATVAGYRLIGYENRLMRHQDFNDDTKDAGDIGAGHAVTALYEIVPAGLPVPSAKVDDLKYQPTRAAAATAGGELMTVKVRYKAPSGKTSKLLAHAVPKVASPALAQTSTDFRWAAAIAGFGMLLRESPHRANLSWRQVDGLAAGAIGRDPEGYRTQALAMIRAAARLPATP